MPAIVEFKFLFQAYPDREGPDILASGLALQHSAAAVHVVGVIVDMGVARAGMGTDIDKRCLESIAKLNTRAQCPGRDVAFQIVHQHGLRQILLDLVVG